MRNFKELLVWQKSIKLVTHVYKVTKDFPDEEKYGLINQMRRSTVSIPSNIAEGHMRNTNKDFGQFLAIAQGSCAELETQIIIAHSLNYIDKDKNQRLVSEVDEIAKMLSSLRSKL
ncbi:MAG: four helix bundle protein [Candidatus Colwellbacteria bacterium RIFCSPLOWO2_01_FULL_48_10]|uniref:Four helix bundle protein n=1 Tax=Candidatus Colwellbacteria bacterium RIFCSPLOWO2_01_FULL_48_10 TaxID=1797690 RepID=A0A1G1Z7Z5_9BACT|nr:MAG: four helix bundle protein [Candidatus Colwellbacteria bacterium RIFCSPLOWO2_01_FULL_48_10]